MEQKLQSEFLSSLIPRFFDLLFLRCVFICPFAYRFFCAQSLKKHRLPPESSHACKKRFSRAKGSADAGLSLPHGRCSRKKHRPKSPCHIFKNRSDQIGRRAIFIVRRLFACLLGIFQCPLCFFCAFPAGAQTGDPALFPAPFLSCGDGVLFPLRVGASTPVALWSQPASNEADIESAAAFISGKGVSAPPAHPKTGGLNCRRLKLCIKNA